MAMRYASRKRAEGPVQQLASLERPAYLLLLPSRSRMTARTAVIVAAVLVAGALAAAGVAATFGTSLNDAKARCLARPLPDQGPCLDRLAGAISTPFSAYPWLVLLATIASLAVATYVAVAVVRLVDERRRHHASLLVEERLARLESAFIAGDVSETTYGRLRQWLRQAGTLDADGDDALQGGRIGRAIALFAFPLSLLPILALFARAALVRAPTGAVTTRATDAADALVANPLLANPLLHVALDPVRELLTDASGAVDLRALLQVTAPALLVTGLLWIATGVMSALLLTVGGAVRDRQDQLFEESWHLVLLAARDRSGDPRRLPLDEEAEMKLAL